MNSDTTNIVDAVQLWYQLANILGVIPYKILKNGTTKISFTGIVSCLIFYSGFVYFSFVDFPDMTSKRFMHQYISFFDFLLSDLLLFFGFIVSTAFYSKKYIFLIKKIYDIDCALKPVNVEFSYGIYRKKLKNVLVVSFAFSNFLQILSLIFTFQSINFSTHIFVVFYLHNLYRWFLSSKPFIILLMLKDRFAVVNKEVFRPFHGKNKVLKLRIYHGELMELCEMLNDFEWIPTACSLGTLFVICISNLYYTYSAYYNRGSEILEKVFDMLALAFHSTFLGIFLIPGFVSVEEEANKTGRMVHKAINEITDAEIRKELSLFSKQLLQGQVRFSANGFFPLNYSFIFSVIKNSNSKRGQY